MSISFLAMIVLEFYDVDFIKERVARAKTLNEKIQNAAFDFAS
jgi:CRISPR/Cas system-associated endoribonuclease Cas2